LARQVVRTAAARLTADDSGGGTGPVLRVASGPVPDAA